MVTDDIGFIVDSWTESWHDGNPQIKRVRFRYYKGPCRDRIHKLVSSSDVIVACDPDNHDHIFGYIVFHRDTVHYTYVLTSRRRVGLMNRMFEASKVHEHGPWFFTHLTQVGMQLGEKKKGEYNPCQIW